MALDRLLPVSTTPGAITGNSYMDAVQEEVTGLWDRSRIKLSAVSGTNTITATVTPALTAGLVDGMSFILVPVATNSGAVTLNGTNVLDAEGTALIAGALRNGATYDLVYRSALSAYVIVGYVPATVTSPMAKLIKTQVASASASIDFQNGVSGVVFDDTYDTYTVDIAGLQPGTDDSEFWMRVGTGGVPTYQTANYKWALGQRNTGGDVGRQSASDSKLMLLGAVGAGQGLGSAAAENGRCQVRMSNPESATATMMVDWAGSFLDTTTIQYAAAGGGSYQAGAAITAIRFMFEAGNIATGRFSLYGLSKV
jgi:hypothetical protein